MSQLQTIQSSLPSDPNVSYINTVHAYDQWANIYDGDGNFLQALDTSEMRSLLPEFLLLVENTANLGQDKQVKLIDLGCGTGRNTLQLLKTINSRTDEDDNNNIFQNVQIIGLDASNGMLDVAREAVSTFAATTKNKSTVSLSQFDLLGEDDDNDDVFTSKADGMISTLVLEHIPLDKYFSKAARLLEPGAYFLVSNMHADMGRLTQAGFVDPATKKKVRPMRSYAHEIGDVLDEAAKAGFEVVPLRAADNKSSTGVEGVIERAITKDILDIIGQRAAKYVGVTVWFGVCFRKK